MPTSRQWPLRQTRQLSGMRTGLLAITRTRKPCTDSIGFITRCRIVSSGVKLVSNEQRSGPIIYQVHVRWQRPSEMHACVEIAPKWPHRHDIRWLRRHHDMRLTWKGHSSCTVVYAPLLSEGTCGGDDEYMSDRGCKIEKELAKRSDLSSLLVSQPCKKIRHILLA